MDVPEREPGDIEKLEALIARERDGDQRDRYDEDDPFKSTV